MIWGISYILAGALSFFSIGQEVDTTIHKVPTIKENEQQTFPRTVPAGNYSGISRINDSLYVVVDDKSITDGFRFLHLDLDKGTGYINSAKMDTLVTNGKPNRDSEGIVYVPKTNTILISGEADKSILEYRLDGTLTGRSLDIPKVFKEASGNLGFESLAYNPHTHLFWTTTESTLSQDGEQATSTNKVCNLLRLQSFDEQMKPQRQFTYIMDAPTANRPSTLFAHGVSDITALDDGRLIILEREFFVPTSIIGSYVNCKLFLVDPSSSNDTLSTHTTNNNKPASRDSIGRKGTKPDSTARQSAKDSLMTKSNSSDSLKVNVAGSLSSQNPTASNALNKLGLYSFRTYLLADNLANFEGMCFGPILNDGSHTLILVSDSQAQFHGILKDWFKVIIIK
jgi:hypothetical protein